MRYTDLVFDLYGTLVDIHTDEDGLAWDKTALYFRFYGAAYTGDSLRAAFQAAMTRRERQAGQSYECFPDIPVEQVMAELFRDRGVTEGADELGFHASQLFRISSMAYLRAYPDVPEALAALRKAGCRLWLLTNAQRSFTAYELRALKLSEAFEGIWISSDYGCRKPDLRFYQALLTEKHLDPSRCLMIGNDRQTDIAGAIEAGMDTLYLHTALTPADQKKADPTLHPGKTRRGRYEFEGDDWSALLPLLLEMIRCPREEEERCPN